MMNFFVRSFLSLLALIFFTFLTTLSAEELKRDSIYLPNGKVNKTTEAVKLALDVTLTVAEDVWSPAISPKNVSTTFRNKITFWEQTYRVVSDSSKVVLAFRGTNASAVSTVTPFKSDPDETNLNLHKFMNGQVGKGSLAFSKYTGVPMGCPSDILDKNLLTHTGWSISANEIYDTFKADLKNHGAENKQIIIAGHSMGGALATYLTYKLLRDNDFRPTQKRHWLITFGAPWSSAKWGGGKSLAVVLDSLAKSKGWTLMSVLNKNDKTHLEWKNSLTASAPLINKVSGRAVGDDGDKDLWWDWRSLPGQTVIESATPGNLIKFRSGGGHAMTEYKAQFEFNTEHKLNNMTGKYVHKPKKNNWHEGRIELVNGEYWWRNSAGRRWRLYPDPLGAYIWTSTDNPYFDKENPNVKTNTFIPKYNNVRMEGFYFQGSYYENW